MRDEEEIKRELKMQSGNVILDDENNVLLIFDGDKLWTSKIIFVYKEDGFYFTENGITGPWERPTIPLTEKLVSGEHDPRPLSIEERLERLEAMHRI